MTIKKNHDERMTSDDHVVQLVVTTQHLNTWPSKLHPNQYRKCRSYDTRKGRKNEVQSAYVFVVGRKKPSINKL